MDKDFIYLFLCLKRHLFRGGCKKRQLFVNITSYKNPLRAIFMRYTEDETGLLNNFAVEPRMYQAEPPTGTEKRNYIILGSVAASLVVTLCVIAASVS